MTTSHQRTAAGQPMKYQAYQVYLRQYSYNIMQIVQEVPLMVEVTALKASHLPAYQPTILTISGSHGSSQRVLPFCWHYVTKMAGEPEGHHIGIYTWGGSVAVQKKGGQ